MRFTRFLLCVAVVAGFFVLLTALSGCTGRGPTSDPGGVPVNVTKDPPDPGSGPGSSGPGSSNGK